MGPVHKYGDKDASRKKHLVVVITADVRRKKLFCVDVRIEGKGYTEASIVLDPIRIRQLDRGDMFI